MVRDMRNTRPEKQSLTPMQKQAVLVCSVCALAAILTIAITMTLLKRGKTPAAPGEQPSSEVLVPGEEDISDHYQISETSAALLPETADAGESYQKETLFLGDSNTVRLYANGLISLQQFCAKEGIGTHAALNEGIVTFKKDSSTYTIAQAVAKMKPRRVVIMLGTNDTGMSVDEFIKNYTALVQAIQQRTGKGFKLCRLPGPAAIQVIVLFLALVRVEGDAAAAVGGGLLQDIALRALNNVPGRGRAVLGGDAHGLEAAVIHGQDAAGVDAALYVGGIFGLIRLPEQAHDVAYIIYAKIHQGTAGTGRVKGRLYIACTEGIVPAGILAEIALYQLHGANAGQQLPDLCVVFKVLGGDGFKQEHLFVPCQIYQFFSLGRRGCQRLFHNNMFACFQRHAGIAHMLQVRHCNVHHIHPLQQFQKIGGVLRHAVLAAKALSQLGTALGAADGLHRKRRVLCKPWQKFPHDLARAKNA